jgi:hypothetical protein
MSFCAVNDETGVSFVSSTGEGESSNAAAPLTGLSTCGTFEEHADKKPSDNTKETNDLRMLPFPEHRQPLGGCQLSMPEERWPVQRDS